MATVLPTNNSTHPHQHQHHIHNPFNMFGLFAKPAAPVVEEPKLGPIGEKGAKMAVISDERFEVIVGQGAKARTWKIHKDLVAQYSTFFSSAIATDSAEAQAGKFVLADQDPAVFALFVEWLYNTTKEIKMGGPDAELFSTDPWVHNAHKAWIMGETFQSTKFQRYALVKFAQGIRFNNANVLFDIFYNKDNKFAEKSAIQKFASAWLWYNRITHALMWASPSWWIGAGDLADPTSLGIVRRMLKDNSFANGGATGLLEQCVDPHWFDIDHWYQECSNRCHGSDGCTQHLPYPCPMNPWGQRKD